MDWPLHKDISQAIETGNWQLGLASLRVWARDMQSRLTELEAKVKSLTDVIADWEKEVSNLSASMVEVVYRNRARPAP